MSIWMAVQHTCQDFDAWKPAFDRGLGLRQEHGAISEMVFANGNDVMVLVEFPDAGSQAAFQADPRLRQDMQDAGVIGAPNVSGPWDKVA